MKSILLCCFGYALVEAATIPWLAVARLQEENPGTTALMRQRASEALAAGKPFRPVQKWVRLASLPRTVLDAVVVAEDGTFFTHGGIDWFEVRESLEKDIQERRAARGASTITQQLAKNLFLSTSKDPVRKLKEVAITLLMEAELSKDRILELYLNVIEWGPGVFGIEAASEEYFGKPAADLTVDEATRLAAVIPSPLRHRPDGDTRYVLRRMRIVRGRMEARNMLPEAVPATAADTAAHIASTAPPETSTAPPETLRVPAADTAHRDTTRIDQGGAHGS